MIEILCLVEYSSSTHSFMAAAVTDGGEDANNNSSVYFFASGLSIGTINATCAPLRSPEAVCIPL